jgi:pyrimidine-specific ribonucleoside hydrolase
MFYPELFEHNVSENHQHQSQNELRRRVNAEEKIIEILSSDNNRIGIVFDQFPQNTDFYRDDVKESMNQILLKHGREEWKLVVLTNEFHSHLGIYSIVGAKMGLRAMEYFHVGRDEMTVVSYAGDNPPISCLNDGLQMSTGATLGQGTIKAITYDLQQRPKAFFTYKNSTISIELKPEYWQTVRADIKKGIKTHGNLTDAYWQFVRELAIRYWLEWSRREIFNIEKVY